MSYYNKKTNTVALSYKTIGNYIIYPITKNLVDVFLVSAIGWTTGARIRVYKGTKEIVKVWGKVPDTILTEVKL